MPHDHDGDGLQDHPPEKCPCPPTQVKHPWQATLRTVIVAGIAFIPIGTALFQATGLDSVPAIAGFIGLGAAVSRVMAMKETEEFLERFAPWMTTGGSREVRQKKEPRENER